MGYRSHPGASERLGTVLALAVAVAAISSSAVLVRWTDASPIALSFWRTAGGALALAPAAMRAGERPSSSDRKLILVAGLALGAHFATWLASLELTSVAASVTLVSTAPIMVAALIAAGTAIARRGGEDAVRPTRPAVGAATWLAVIAAVAGAAVIALGDIGRSDDAAPAPLAGDALALAGALAMAVYLLTGDQVRSGLSTAAYAARAYGIAAAALLLVALATGVPLIDHPPRTWAVIAAMIVGPQLLGHTLLNLLLRRLGSVSVSLALLAEPIGASALAWLLLSQAPPAAVWIGAPIVLLAVGSQVLGPAAPTREPVVAADQATEGISSAEGPGRRSSGDSPRAWREYPD